MKIFGMIGWSGSGKTTLIKLLIPELISRGYSVSSMKHTHHDFDIDKPGKDSFEHRVAGAKQVLISGSKRWALLNENRDQHEPSVDDLLEKMEPVDLVLIEGFKKYPHSKLEVYRPSAERKLIAREDTSVVAIATDEDVDGGGLPIIDLNNVAAVADFVIAYCGLEKKVMDGAA
jgi:molybdopterin-guanine dinucleotide biosynthesis protein B